MDATNYYPQRDGVIPELDAATSTTSQVLAQHLVGARVVKAWNAILEKDIETDARPRGAPNRRAIPIAGRRRLRQRRGQGADRFAWI